MTAAQRGRYLKTTALKANGRVLAEWNLNRFSGGPTVRNHLIPEQVNDIYYDVESVAKPDRPTRGIVKAMTQGDAFSGAGRVSSVLYDLDRGATAYVVSESDQYKYWISPSRSALSFSSPGVYPISKAGIEITYLEAMPCNKILVTFETTISTPKSVTVSYRFGGVWTATTISNPVVDNDGRMILWRQSDDSFSQNEYLSTDTVPIDGIRLQINSINSGDNHAAVIELSPRLVVDVSEYVVNASASYEMSDDSKVAPLGVASSNVGNVELDNSDRYFSNGNLLSPFYGLIGRGIEFSLYTNPTKVDAAPVDSEEIPIFTNMSTTQVSESENSVIFEVKDGSRVLQERTPPSILFEDCSVTEAVLRICHSVGFNEIDYDSSDVSTSDRYSRIPYFWTDDEQTAWENISSIAEATQTAVYFDEFGKLQIQTRRSALNLSNPVVWTFDADDPDPEEIADTFRPADEVGKFADISSMNRDDEEVPNNVNVKYYETVPAKSARGVPEMDIAWEPEGDVVLRAARLRLGFSSNSPSVRFTADDVITWPFKGMFQVNQEVIEYDAKRYQYYLYPTGSSYGQTWVTSIEEQRELDALAPGRAWQNQYTGQLRISKRGLFSTKVSNHWYDDESYLVRRRIEAGKLSNYNGLTVNAENGYAALSTGTTSGNAWVVAKRASTNLPRIVGTRVTFPVGGGSAAAAGVTIGCGSNDTGIYIELAKSTSVGNRTQFNELNVYWKSSAGVGKRYGPESGKGVPMVVAEGVGYDIDVYYGTEYGEPGVPVGPNHFISVFVNGENKMNINVPRSETISLLPKEQGFFVRGAGGANFEHFYYVGDMRNQIKNPIESPSVYDIVRGASRSMVFNSSAAWAPYTSRFTEPWDATGALDAGSVDYGNNLFMDEFGMIAHEVREFNVDFEDEPMIYSNLYVSNETQSACHMYRANPFAAKFILSNTSRFNAVLQGEDSITYGEDNVISHRMMIYGRPLRSEEAQDAKYVNDYKAIRDGKIDLTVDNKFIQTEQHAEAIAKWVATDSGGGESLQIETFANPHIQMGDIVSVSYPSKDMDHINSRYFVVGKSVNYNGGLELDLTLRSMV